jgi:hypothetical protein
MDYFRKSNETARRKPSENDQLDDENRAAGTLQFLLENDGNVNYINWFKIGSQHLLDSSGS